MEYAKSRLQDMYLHLQRKGFSVYFVGQKVGECVSPYAVVRQSTSSKVAGISSTVTYYDVLCYVPAGHVSELDPYIETVKDAMKELAPMITPTYVQTAPFRDDDIGAYMSSVQYKNYRKI